MPGKYDSREYIINQILVEFPYFNTKEMRDVLNKLIIQIQYSASLPLLEKLTNDEINKLLPSINANRFYDVIDYARHAVPDFFTTYFSAVRSAIEEYKIHLTEASRDQETQK